MAEFQPDKSYVSCGNGCNAHFQNENEEILRSQTIEHNQKCSKATPYKTDANAFYFVESATASSKPAPNWTDFNLKFMSDRDYNAIAQTTTNQRSVTRLESFTISHRENFPLLKFLWDEIISGLVIPPSSITITTWNAIAVACFMPFKFDKTGKMVLS